MENKVKFHALERLDLVDVNALQDNMYTYLAKALGNLVGNASGLLQRPVKSNITIASELIEFPDFVYIEAQDDTDFADSFENRVIAFDASLSGINGTCGYDTFKSSTQTYYDDNNSIPNGPRESGYDSNDSIYFPFIWVRKREIDATNDVRRFWNVSDGAEETQPVNTRKKFAVDFLLSSTTPAGGYTLIGRIIKWELTGGVVDLPANAVECLELYTFADNIYFTNGSDYLDSSSEYSQLKQVHGGGLKMALQTIRKQITDIRGNGSADAGISNTPTSPFNGLPYLSLDALYQQHNNNLTIKRQGQCVITLNLDHSASTHTLTTNHYTNTSAGNVISIPNVYIDYSMMSSVNSGSFPLTFNFGSDATAVRYWIASSSLLALDFGDTYLGYGIRANCTVISCLVDDYSGTNNTIDLMRDTTAQGYRFHTLTSYLHTESRSGNLSDVMQITGRTRKDTSNADQNFTGIKVGLGGLENVITESNLTTYDLKITVKIDFELIKP